MTKVTVREDDKSYIGGDGLIWFGVVLFAVLLILVNENRNLNGDFRFLYNRAYQMLSCIKDGRVPFFYYKDFFEVGYGTAFFYGHLILYPFLIFANMGENVFMNILIICDIVFVYLGTVFLAKRFTYNYKLIGFLCLSSLFSIRLLFCWGNFINTLVLGLSFFFLAFCVDFFRDKKSFIPASLIFFIILSSHLVTALLSFFGCIFVLLCYFDIKQLRQYIYFCCVTSCLSIYALCNMLYHRDILTRIDDIDKGIIAGDDKISLLFSPYFNRFVDLDVWFSRVVTNELHLLDSMYGYPVIGLSTFLICVIMYIRHKVSSRDAKFNFKFYFCLLLILFAYLYGIENVWVWLGRNIFTNPIQFPLRYGLFLVFLFLILCLRHCNISKLVFNVLVLIGIGNIFFSIVATYYMNENDTKANMYDTVMYVGNGEYLDKSFIWDGKTFDTMRSQVTDEAGKKYEYHIDKDKVIITVPKHTDDLTLTFPKLYYRGYRLTGDGVSFNVEMGKSQFIKSNIGKYYGKLVLQYVHPIWLVALDFITLFSALILTIYCLLKRYRPNIISRLNERWSRLWSQIIKSRICRER